MFKNKGYFAKALVAGSIVLSSAAAMAYPSSDIVDTLPGVHRGVLADGRACEVQVTKTLGTVQFAIVTESQERLEFDRVTNLGLKYQYNENYKFRKEQDRSFNPDTANPWLIYYVNHGIPSFFGIFPQTDKLEINWDQNKLYSVEIAISYSNGGPYETQPDPRNVTVRCAQLN